MSDIKRTVELLMANADFRSRLFAIDLLIRHSSLFEPKDLAERLKLASLDSNGEVVKKAKLSMSHLLKEGFTEEKKIRDLGIHSRLMDLSETEMEIESKVRARASALLAPVMEKVSLLARDAPNPVAGSALAVIGASRAIEFAPALIEATHGPQLKKAAYDALKNFKIPEGVDLVASVLGESKAEEDLGHAADILGELGLAPGLAFLRGLMDHPSPEVRRRAAQAIGRLAGGDGEKVLIDKLGDPDPETQAVVIAALGKCGSSSAIDALLPVFPMIRHPDVIAQCLRTFGRLRSGRALASILGSLANPLASVKTAALEALARYSLKPDDVQRHLVPLLADPDSKVRAGAIVALYPHDHVKASVALRTMLTSKRAPDRAAAMALMGDVQDPAAMEEFLVSVNTEQDRAILAGGLDAIDKISDPRLKKSVQRLLAHPNGSVRMKAMRAYARIAGAVVIKDLDRLYDESDSEVQKSAILSTLGEICESGNISHITKHLKESDERVVANAIDALDRVGSIENATILEPFLSHPSPRVRANTVVALFHTGNFRCLSTLTEMLGKSDEGTLRSALHAVRKIHESLCWQDIQKRPLLMTPLLQKAPEGSIKGEPSMTRGSVVIPRPTHKIALDATSPEERELVRAALAQADGMVAQAKDHLGRILAAQPDHELALYLRQRMPAGDQPPPELAPEILDRSSFLPLLSEETRVAKASRDMKRMLRSYFRIFERQLKVMQSVITEGLDYLEKGGDAQAMEVAKFIVSQMQWTVDFDLKLGTIFYDKQDWERTFHHLLRAFLTSGCDGAVGVRLAAAAMKLRKKELAKMILTSILNSESVDPVVRERAVQVAQALAGV